MSSVSSIVAALGRWSPEHADLFRRAAPALARTLALPSQGDDEEEAPFPTPAGWVYAGAAPGVVAMWHREDETDRVYLRQEGSTWVVEAGIAGDRELGRGPRGVGLAIAARYMVPSSPPAEETRTRPPRADGPLEPAARAVPFVVTDVGYSLSPNASPREEEEAALAIIRHARELRERQEGRGKAGQALATTRKLLRRLPRNDLARLRAALARVDDARIRDAQGWYALGAMVKDELVSALRGEPA